MWKVSENIHRRAVMLLLRGCLQRFCREIHQSKTFDWSGISSSWVFPLFAGFGALLKLIKADRLLIAAVWPQLE